MPLIRISLLKGKPASYRRKIGDAVRQALVETIDVPAKDRSVASYAPMETVAA
jgi:hypothetical protein